MTKTKTIHPTTKSVILFLLASLIMGIISQAVKSDAGAKSAGSAAQKQVISQR